ncbi:AMP-binding protein [Bacteroidota bacterium]
MNFLYNIKSVWEGWQYNADRFPNNDAIVHWIAGENPYRWSYGELFKCANKFSVQLRKIGVKPNQVCALIIKHNPLFYPIYLSVVGIGALPAVLAYPNPRLHPDKFRNGLVGMSQRSGLDWILTERDLEPIIKPLVNKKDSTVKGLLYPLEWEKDAEMSKVQEEINNVRSNVSLNDHVLLQHSSGTTGLQKPVILSHNAIIKHVIDYSLALNITRKDKIVSWLPLYHDMGLIAAFHMPLLLGIPAIQLDPFEWVIAPFLLCQAISDEKATISWLPNFAYNFMADKINDEELEGLSLESLRLVINCSEPVRDVSHKKFIAKFSKYKLDPDSISTCYAMAETTFAVSQSLPGNTPLEITTDRDELAKGRVKLADNNSVKRICVSSGRLINNCKVKIVNDSREMLKGKEVGEIAVKSVSLFDGYRNYPEKTSQVFDEEGWFYTGDYGFIYEDELFVIGRKKDIIIEGGINIYPEDVEDAVNRVQGVIAGRIIAFGEEEVSLGTEHVSVVAETNKNPDEYDRLRIEIIRAGMGINVTIKKVYLVPPRWLIKSSSGKPSRKTNSERLINNINKEVWSK